MKITVTASNGKIIQENEDVRILAAVLLSPKSGPGFLLASDPITEEKQIHIANNYMTVALQEVIEQSINFCEKDIKSLENDMKLELLRKFNNELDSLLTSLLAMHEKGNSNVTH